MPTKRKRTRKTSKSTKSAKADECCGTDKCSCHSGCNWGLGIVSEVAFYFSLYYILYLLQVGGNLWVRSLILFGLINVSIIFCPVLWMHCKK